VMWSEEDASSAKLRRGWLGAQGAAERVECALAQSPPGVVGILQPPGAEE
jgi:hypothetical protein